MIIYWSTLEKDAGDVSTIPDYVSSNYVPSVHFARNIYWEGHPRKSGVSTQIQNYIASTDFTRGLYPPAANKLLALGPSGDLPLPAGISIESKLSGNVWKNQSFVSCILNGGLEGWSAGDSSAPDGFLYYQDGAGGSVAKESTEKKIGSYSAKITKSSAGDSQLYQRLNATLLGYVKGRTFTLGAWVKSANTVANQVKIALYDDVTGLTNSYYQNSGDWEWLTVTKTFSPSATIIDIVKLYVYSAADAVGYFDGVIVVEGNVCPAFSPLPLGLISNTKATAGAPYTNDGFIYCSLSDGTIVKVMTTA